MTIKISSFIIGNNRKQCIAEIITQMAYYSHEVEILEFRKVRNKDLFRYKCKVTIA